MESVGNGRDESETDSSSKTLEYCRVAVVFTGRTIPLLSGRKEINNNLVNRGEESGEKICIGRVGCDVAD